MFRSKNEVYLDLIATFSKAYDNQKNEESQKWLDVILNALKTDKHYCEMILKAIRDVDSSTVSNFQYASAINFINERLEDPAFKLLQEAAETIRKEKIVAEPIEKEKSVETTLEKGHDQLRIDFVKLLAAFYDLEARGEAKDNIRYNVIMKAFKENQADFSRTVVNAVREVDTGKVSRIDYEKATNFLNQKAEEKGFDSIKEALYEKPSRKPM